MLGTILAGISVQVFPILFMGFKDAQFLKFCCGATEDFMYHMELTRQVIRHIPPEEPGLANIALSNYHYWGNIVIGELIRVFRLPFVFTHFQYFGLLISSLLGLTALSFCQITKLKKITAWLLVFFLYFSGDFIYILILITRRVLDVSPGALESGPIFLYNPPRAFSIVILFAGLSLFSVWIKKKNIYSGILTAIVLGSTIGFKANTGIFALTGLAAVFLFFLFRRRFTMLVPILLSAVISLTIYLPTNKNSGGLYYSGFWRFDDFATNPNTGLAMLELRRITYASQNNWLKVLLYNIFFMILYTISTFGSKLVGLLQSKKSLSSLDLEMNILLIVGIIISTITGFFFLQTSGEANSFNFIVTVYIMSSIYASLALSYWFSKMSRYFSLSIVALLVIINLPRAITESQKTVIMVQKSGGISNEDIHAMLYIRDHLEKNAIILTQQPFYIFLAERSIFLGKTGILRSHNVNYAKRNEIVKKIYSEQNNEVLKDILMQ
ncbi:hypothetical protein HYV22_01345 [Candidatus Gottesmanbacteria bacterium]|nr:hypothetical protein [Candidatus Gottesmanbacteria bacterium]